MRGFFLLFSFLAIMPHNKIGKPKKDGIIAVGDLLPVETYRTTPNPISNIPTIMESLVIEVIFFLFSGHQLTNRALKEY